MPYCPNCGVEVPADASECHRCHALFTDRGWQPLAQPPKTVAVMVGGGPGQPGTAEDVPPVRAWPWIVGGALYGVLLRVLFGALPASTQGAMSAAFLVGTPFVIGALSIWGARDRELNFWLLIRLPMTAVLLTLFGCAVTLLEGSICLVLMAPLFLLGGFVGGLVMALVLTVFGAQPVQLRALVVLPFFMLFAEEQVPLKDRQLELRQSVQIAAPPARVWREIMTARDIRADELPLSLTHLMGVPRPVEGVNVATPEGEVRHSRWDRGVRFEGKVRERREPEFIRWEYAFDAHSFPPGSMDEHVAIGGRYFDLQDTAFTLHESQGGTRLEIVAHYRVTSSVNFYAVPAATLLGHDFIATILGLYKLRSEKAA
jgi:uncharacterized protein YndB with AHSA1/START domain